VRHKSNRNRHVPVDDSTPPRRVSQGAGQPRRSAGAIHGDPELCEAQLPLGKPQFAPTRNKTLHPTLFVKTDSLPNHRSCQRHSPAKVALIGTVWMAAASLLRRPRGTGTASGGSRLGGQEWKATNLPWDSGGVHSKSFFIKRGSLCSGSGPRHDRIMARGGGLLADCHPQGEVRLLTGAEIASTSSSGQNSKNCFSVSMPVPVGDFDWSKFDQSAFNALGFDFAPRLCAGEGKREGIGRAGGSRGSRFGTLQATRRGSRQGQLDIVGICCFSTHPRSRKEDQPRCWTLVRNSY
jgi:hypothetical protein